MAAPNREDALALLRKYNSKQGLIRHALTVESVMGHFVDALTARRQAHEMGAIFSGKMPHAASNLPGGITATVTKENVIEHLKGSLAKWQLPDDVIFVDELPHTATGKILKTKLRSEYGDYKLPTN